jgi:hypothetical protein
VAGVEHVAECIGAPLPGLDAIGALVDGYEPVRPLGPAEAAVLRALPGAAGLEGVAGRSPGGEGRYRAASGPAQFDEAGFGEQGAHGVPGAQCRGASWGG